MAAYAVTASTPVFFSDSSTVSGIVATATEASEQQSGGFDLAIEIVEPDKEPLSSRMAPADLPQNVELHGELESLKNLYFNKVVT